MNTIRNPKHKAQWKIERVEWHDRELILKCQADLRQLGSAADTGKILLKEMRFNTADRAHAQQLEQIGLAIRQSSRLPNTSDEERWTGCEFVWTDHADPANRITAAKQTGQYRVWLPDEALALYARIEKGKVEGLCERGVTFIGGGTILAARWRHRKSTDIDIFWKKGRWTPNEERQRIERWLSLLDENPTRKLLSSNVNKIEWPKGDTDFIATPILENNDTRDTVVRTALTACSTREILAGKIIGRALIPFRDVFDAAVAVLKQPHEMDGALAIAAQYPISGASAIERIPDYCRRINQTGDWKNERAVHILEARCPDAWENGPRIVQAHVQRWSRQNPRRKLESSERGDWEQRGWER